MPKLVEILKQKFAHSVRLPFQELLPESKIVEALASRKNQEKPAVRLQAPTQSKIVVGEDVTTDNVDHLRV